MYLSHLALLAGGKSGLCCRCFVIGLTTGEDGGDGEGVRVGEGTRDVFRRAWTSVDDEADECVRIVRSLST